jgi:TolA-binding protein
VIGLLRFLIRLVLVILLAVLLGAGIYFGVPALYRRYIQPVERNLAQVNDAQARQEGINQQMDQQLEALQSRLEKLELQNDTHKQTLDELVSRLDNLETSAQPNDDRQALEKRLSDLESAVQTASDDLATLQNQVVALDQTQAQIDLQLQDIARKADIEQVPLQALRNELLLVKAMEHLTRSRLFLVEDNLGLAEQDVSAARLLLAGLQGQVPPYQVDALGAILTRLDAAIENLPARPVLAAEDLEVAWQLLRFGLPGEATPFPTLTEELGTGTPTPTPLPIPATPTPSPTPAGTP